MNNEIIINNVDPQQILINGGGAQAYGIVDVLVNGISVVTNNVANVEVPTKTSELVNDSGFITGITSNDVTTALGYTPGTSNFSGNYNDLTNKPTIPSVVANPATTTQTLSSLQIDGVGYSIAGGGGTSYSLSKTFET